MRGVPCNTGGASSIPLTLTNAIWFAAGTEILRRLYEGGKGRKAEAATSSLNLLDTWRTFFGSGFSRERDYFHVPRGYSPKTIPRR